MLISHDLVNTLEQSEIYYMTDRMKAIQNRAGNPEGVEIERFGGCTAFYSKTMPWGQFNNVKGPLEEEVARDVIHYYGERNRSFEFQIVPGRTNPAVMKTLHEHGFYQSGFHTTMYCEARQIQAEENEELLIRELEEDEFDTYARIHCLGTGLPVNGIPAVARNNRVLYGREGWRFYMGFYKDEPAAVAVMYMADDVASLTFATTLPEYRNKGFQSRLLKKRIHDADTHGCKLVVGQCAFCSTSHRNMERAGMKIGYTRAAWTQST